MAKKSGCKPGYALFRGKCVELGMHSLITYHKNKGYKPEVFQVTGKLTGTNRKVKPVRYSSRSLYKDESNQLWAVIDSKLWRFPQDIEY